MSVEFDREVLGKFDSRTLSRKTLSRWTGRTCFVPDPGGANAEQHARTHYYVVIITIIISLVIIIITRARNGFLGPSFRVEI